MSLLNGLTTKKVNLLVALDAKVDDELSLDFVTSRLLQKERRPVDKSPAIKRIGHMSLFGAYYRDQNLRGGSLKIEYYNCHNSGLISHVCPVVKANKQRKVPVAAIAADDGRDSDGAICLVGNSADNDDIYK